MRAMLTAGDSIIHGAAKGADHIADICAFGKWLSTPYPADWNRDGKAAGPIRNARMLKDGKPDRGLAFGVLWKPGRRVVVRGKPFVRTGTGDMVHRMLAAGLPVRWVASPDAEAVDLTEMPRRHIGTV